MKRSSSIHVAKVSTENFRMTEYRMCGKEGMRGHRKGQRIPMARYAMSGSWERHSQ